MLKQIGKYTISERIGRGTYSRVYRAVDAQGRPVAIKVSTTQTEPQHLDEFQRDLVAAASVLHPHLVAVHDLGFEDDFPYLVMELVEGQDLDRLLKNRGAPGLAERIRVMQQVGSSLKAAHERGVFHLDLRPSKIMLANDGEAKLLDLGLGRLSFDPARVTEHGYLVGAPFYMSPERLTAIDTANERCDIWSFGVTFYEWICGHHPFYDDDGDRMVGNIMDAVPADLQNVPSQLNHTIRRAMEKDPADRYRNFAELLADLQPLVSDLKREESDALMAEALKQTDSGRWHEARRIARQMREADPKEGPSSQIFGISEPEVEKERVPESARPAAMAPVPPPPAQKPLAVAVAESASASALAAAIAVDTPEPAPPLVQATPPVQVAPPAPLPRAPQRPERTPPRIPQMGARNGGPASAENGSPASARVQPTATPANDARAATLAGAGAAAAVAAANGAPAIVRELPTSRAAVRPEPRPEPRPGQTRYEQPTTEPFKPEQARARRRRSSSSSQRRSARILDTEEQIGFPWGKILGFGFAALLIFGGFLFFLRSTGKLKLPFSDDAKQLSRSGRVIKSEPGDPVDPIKTLDPNTAATPPGGPPTVPQISPATPAATSTATGNPAALPATTPGNVVAPATTVDPLNPLAPKTFDPKTLTSTKGAVVSKRRGNAPLTGLAAPALSGSSETSEVSGFPVAMNAPPPPAAPVALAPAKIATPAAAPAPTVKTPEATSESAAHVGGLFLQPVLVKTVQPVYPPAALQRKAQGTVRFQATIAKDGSVKNIQLLSGDPMLNVSARQAVLQWKYRPATLNGEPIEVTQAIVVNFNLNNR